MFKHTVRPMRRPTITRTEAIISVDTYCTSYEDVSPSPFEVEIVPLATKLAMTRSV